MTDIAQAAVVRLTLRFPFWCECFYSMTLKETVPEDKIDTLATDGRTLWINRAFFSKLPLDQQVGVLVHELCHKIFLHITRRGHRDPQLWNIAADLAVNSLIKANSIALPPEGLYDPQYDGWLAEAIYADLLKKIKDSGKSAGQPGSGVPGLPNGWADIKEPQGSPEQIAKLEDEIKATVDRAIANAKAMGKLPAGIEDGTAQAYKPAGEPWYNHLHRYMQSLAVSEYNWAKLNRRALRSHGCFAPLHYSEALGEVVLFIDTSGSCFDKAAQANFAGHLNAILSEAKPRKLHVYYFDTQVYPGEVIEAGEFDVKTHPKGGGGTSFIPLFAQLEQDGIEPEVCIILTDLYGTFPPHAPEYAVVWADVDGGTVPPWGEHIHVES